MEQTENTKARDTHTADMIDHYWGSVNHVTDLIRASEIKAGLILSFYGLLMNLIYQSAGSWVDPNKCDIIWYILVGLWVGSTSISIFFSIRCFIPKIEKDYGDNIFFFGDVITKFGTIKEFAKTFYQVSLNEEQLFKQMGEQIFIISKIAAWKFENVKRAVRYLAIGLILLFATAIYYFILTIKYQ
jgi:hypothetical protein